MVELEKYKKFLLFFGLFVASAGLFGFGAANWNCYCTGDVPTHTAIESPERYQVRMLRYMENKERAHNGEGAQVSFPLAVGLTLAGISGVVSIAGRLLWEYGG